MTEEIDLIEAIHASPDEDVPRLMYADWLDEYGDPDRAEFIRVQVALAKPEPKSRIDPTAAIREWNRLLDRERELLSDANYDKWTSELCTGGCRGPLMFYENSYRIRSENGNLIPCPTCGGCGRISELRWLPPGSKAKALFHRGTLSLRFTSHYLFPVPNRVTIGPHVRAICHIHPLVTEIYLTDQIAAPETAAVGLPPYSEPTGRLFWRSSTDGFRSVYSHDVPPFLFKHLSSPPRTTKGRDKHLAFYGSLEAADLDMARAAVRHVRAKIKRDKKKEASK